MIKRTFMGLFLFGFLLLILYLSSFSRFFFDAVLVLVMVLASVEMYKAMRKLEYKPVLTALITMLVCVFPLCYFYYYVGLLIAFLVSFLTAFVSFIFNSKKGFWDFIITIFLLIYPITIISLALVLNNYYGLIPTLFAVGAALMSDTLAYFCGSLFGKKKIFPKISPKKTYTGCLMGLLGGAIGGLVIYALFEIAKFPADIRFTFSSVNSFAYLIYIFGGILMAVASEMGDLGASRIKREVGLKDYGTILGSHGGVMDRIDSVLFSLIVMSIIMYFAF